MTSVLEPRLVYHRNLPHWRLDGVTYFTTWRLDDRSGDLSPEDRSIVLQVLRYFRGRRYHLYACVVMDDHVHAIVRPFKDHTLSSIMHSWKSYSAHELNRRSHRTGQVWQHESYDRIVRNTRDLWEKICYIQSNPQRRWPTLITYPWVWPPVDYGD